MIDFNPRTMREQAANAAVNAAVDAAVAQRIAGETRRDYLGASSLGHDCLRKIAWDWRSPVRHEPRTERIFARGRWLEDYAAALLVEAGFRILRSGERLAFSQLDGRFRGHGDGLILSGPEIEGLGYPALWECKGLGSKGWTKLKKDGLAKAYQIYAAQVALYQAYFDLTGPALFTACNMDTMEILHLLVPFDVARAQAASDRAVTVVRAVEAGETFPKITDDPDDFRCRFCSHRERCWE